MPHETPIRKAEAFSEKAHEGQKRDDGRPYATHPAAVAKLLRESGINDPNTLAAAYLHDVLEDTLVSPETLAAEFGETVTKLVEELTNMPPDDATFDEKHADDATFDEKHAALAEKARRMSDPAKLVKLADRLHNLSDMASAWSAERQERYLRVTVGLLAALEPTPAAGNAMKAKIEDRLRKRQLF